MSGLLNPPEALMLEDSDRQLLLQVLGSQPVTPVKVDRLDSLLTGYRIRVWNVFPISDPPSQAPNLRPPISGPSSQTPISGPPSQTPYLRPPISDPPSQAPTMSDPTLFFRDYNIRPQHAMSDHTLFVRDYNIRPQQCQTSHLSPSTKINISKF